MNIEWNKVTWYSKLFAALVLLGVILLGIYFRSEFKKVYEIEASLPFKQISVKNSTSDWKTYRNEKYGLEVKYPSTWNAGVDSVVGDTVVLFCPQELSDVETICKIKNNSPHMSDTEAPIIYSPIKKKLELINASYVSVFEKMQKSLTFLVPVTVDKQTYIDDKYGFSFYYPKTWIINDNSNGTVLTNFGPYKDDKLSIKRVEGNQVLVQDAKFGNTTLYFDEGLRQWIKIAPNREEKYVSMSAVPSFYTISGLPVFASTGRWRTYIVALSHMRFIVVNITGSGWTEAIEPFVKSIVSTGSFLENKDINRVVQEQIDSEKK